MGCCASELESLFNDDELVPQVVTPSREQLQRWAELGGDQLEEPIREGWVKLVRASWLVKLSESGGVLRRRQDLPQKAFVSLDELRTVGDQEMHWLRIIVLSYPWLQPGHPDPHGQSLRVIAKALKVYINDVAMLNKPFGVLIDFTGLFQADRTDDEKRIFDLALPELNRFYSHPRTIVLKVTQFPPRYPNDPSYPYILPAGANVVEYMGRGWCFAESAMSGLVKSIDLVLDLAKFRDDFRDIRDMLHGCIAGRPPPLHPEEFTAELHKKSFTNKHGDFDKVAKLYSAAFWRLMGSAQHLTYSNLAWGPHEARQLVRALRGNTTLHTLDLSNNNIGSEGAAAVAEALPTIASLEKLYLDRNDIGPEGGDALVQALRINTTLKHLFVQRNNLGKAHAALKEVGGKRVSVGIDF